MDATLLKELFLQRLPSSVRIVLTPSARVFIADCILEASPLNRSHHHPAACLDRPHHHSTSHSSHTACGTAKQAHQPDGTCAVHQPAHLLPASI